MRAVMPSVGYADMLAVTVPAWQAVLPTAALRIVTDPADRDTQLVGEMYGIPVIVSTAWRADGAVFNKAKALDDALGFEGTRPAPDQGAVCLALDADAYPCGSMPCEDAIQAGVLYGCDRLICPSSDILSLYQQGSVVQGLQLRTRGARGGGYFQLFRYQDGMTFGSFPDAGHYDLQFHRYFTRIENVSGFHVLHLGRTSSKNWKGRVLPPWRAA